MIDLNALNSATKYPSIPTYHALGERGVLLEETVDFHGDVIVTEKVDGTNGRIIRMPGGDWFIGSREELLTARGDRVHNPGLGIVDALKPLAQRLVGSQTPDMVMVFFLEVYGAKIGGAARQYTGSGAVGYRMFDLAWVPLHVLDWEREHIAAWRDGGGQKWSTETVLEGASEAEGIPLTPRLDVVNAADLPTGLTGTHEWLRDLLPESSAMLDGGAGGRAEGVVLRTSDRSVIAKARFQDYERTLKGGQSNKRPAAVAANAEV